jgi:hypothetical protein
VPPHRNRLADRRGHPFARAPPRLFSAGAREAATVYATKACSASLELPCSADNGSPWRKIEMKQLKRYVVCGLFLAAAMCVAAASRAQSPFDGTWRIDAAKAKFDPKPFTIYTSDGWYHCVSCTPPFAVQADGQFHAISGEPFDTISATLVDPHTILIVSKKGDKTIEEDKGTVSADGKVFSLKTTTYPLNGSGPQNSSMTLKRAGVLPAGVHATSGNWVATKMTDSDADLTFTFKSNGDEVSMTDPTGDSYTAKFDGNDYPYKGNFGINAVSLKQVDAHTFEETDKFNGKVMNVSKMTVSPDGKSMTIVSHNPQNDLSSTFIATRK